MIALIAQSSSSSSNPIALFLPLILIGGVFYFLLIRPQQKRVRAQQALVNAVQEGDEVVTIGGIFGTVIEIDDDEGTVLVEIAPGIEIRMVKTGIVAVASPRTTTTTTTSPRTKTRTRTRSSRDRG